ncbi:hypothetical protein GCM10009838_24990 [Catenulispora subtropica]|uniref:Uncharacterized protein n=1 Tax=Catenulispora subtropica TaxID=450798 RepID=A0ABN2RAR4_9ACTN
MTGGVSIARLARAGIFCRADQTVYCTVRAVGRGPAPNGGLLAREEGDSVEAEIDRVVSDGLPFVLKARTCGKYARQVLLWSPM